MTDIRGIHYEVSKPVLNERDGYWYQRVRQVDEHGNLVGQGDQLKRLPNPGSLDGQVGRDLDWAKIGKLGGDVGQVGIGIFKRDPRMISRGTVSFAKDVQDGVYKEYDSWPGTDKPWEQGDIPAPMIGGNAPYSPPHIGTPDEHSEDTTAPDNRTSSVVQEARQATPVSQPTWFATSPNPNAVASPPEADGPIGLFSGKPMRFIGAPIFDSLMRSGAGSDQNRPSALDDLLQGYARSRSWPSDASAAAPSAPNLQNLFSSGNGVASSAISSGDAFAPPVRAPQQSDGPLSLNDAYLLYLNRLAANGSQPSPMSNLDAPAAPLVPSNGAVGNSSNGLSPKPESSDEPLSLMDAYLLYLKRLEASRSQAIDMAADV